MNYPPPARFLGVQEQSSSKKDKHLRKQRQSNIELLRIIAMFLVLVVHADFWANRAPSQEECINDILPSITRYTIESLSIVCVDVFVLISGWFGIRPNVRRMSSFLFQCFFFLGGLYIVSLVGGFGKLNATGILGCFGLLEWNWFIKAYIGLCILAPIINSFIDGSNERKLRYLIIWFYIFQSAYGWIFPAAKFIELGYSVFSFVGLYLIAQYIRRYHSKRIESTRALTFFSIYLATVTINTIWAYFAKRYGLPFGDSIYYYTNPFVIIGSISLLLTFYKMKLQNKIINWIAASSFAVFLFHGAPAMNQVFFKANCIDIYNKYSGAMCLLSMFAFLTIVFACSILLDQLRIATWNKLSTIIFKPQA